jgi:hypothetical protein
VNVQLRTFKKDTVVIVPGGNKDPSISQERPSMEISRINDKEILASAELYDPVS